MTAAKPTWDAIDAAVKSLAESFDRAGHPCDSEDVELIVPWKMAETLASERGETLAYDADGRAFLGSFYGVELSTYRKPIGEREIEIAPEMIKAGADAALNLALDVLVEGEAREIAEDVYLAMEKARIERQRKSP